MGPLVPNLESRQILAAVYPVAISPLAPDAFPHTTARQVLFLAACTQLSGLIARWRADRMQDQQRARVLFGRAVPPPRTLHRCRRCR